MLTIVPTPIGNLKDITIRALDVLKDVDVILAEDTRQTKKLLSHYEISTPLKAYHQHNEHKLVESIVSDMESGSVYALVSDAGTPAISDPGFLLVREAVLKGVKVECLPGAVAFVPALVVSGLPSDRFVFEGFLPHKKGRKTRLEYLSTENRTVVFYESPHRIVKLLQQLVEFFGADREVSVARELTKMYEEIVRGPALEVQKNFEARQSIKGEFVVVVKGN